MVKLNKEDIQFIENYLENSDVIHVDVRMEMTDHIASEIETLLKANPEIGFYNVFKSYMIENKADLLNDNKKFLKAVINKNTRRLFKELIAFRTIVIFAVLLFLSNYILTYLNPDLLKYVFFIPFVLFLVIAIIYFTITKIYKLSRFSGVERLAFMYSMAFQIFHFISIITRPRIEELKTITLAIIFAFSIILIYAFVKISISVVKSYTLKYKAIA